MKKPAASLAIRWKRLHKSLHGRVVWVQIANNGPPFLATISHSPGQLPLGDRLGLVETYTARLWGTDLFYQVYWWADPRPERNGHKKWLLPEPKIKNSHWDCQAVVHESTRMQRVDLPGAYALVADEHGRWNVVFGVASPIVDRNNAERFADVMHQGSPPTP